MDSWFNQLFEIIGRQTESKKTEMLLPEIYGELDILARKQDINELQEIYEFVEEKNPIKTEDVIYNKNAYAKLKKEILKRHVMLRDFSIINRDLVAFINEKNQKEINKMLATWKDSSYVYNYIQETIFNAKQKKKVFNPESAERTIKVTTPFIKKEPVIEKQPVVKKEEPVIEKKEPIVKKPEPIAEEKKEEPKPIKEPKPELFKETVPEFKPEPVKEPIKEPVKEPIKEEPPVKTQKEKKSFFSKKEIDPKRFENADVLKEPEVIIKPKIDRDFPKPKPQKPIVEQEVNTKEEKPVEIREAKDPHELFFDCVDIIAKKYNMIVNVEMLRKLTNPVPNFSRFLLQFIDEEDRNARFFIELFKLLTEYGLIDVITYIINKSFKIKKLCSFNIGLLNEPDIDTKNELLDIIVKQDFDFIKLSNYERKVRTYIDNSGSKDTTTKDIQSKVLEISKYAPLMMQPFYASDAIGFFKINIMTIQDRILEPSNLAHLYWTMIYAACLSIYVIRDKYTDFIDSMDCITDMATQLMKKADDLEIRYAVKTLASSYIRTIYKIGTELPDYGDWWDRHKDDMLESKHRGLAALNPID